MKTSFRNSTNAELSGITLDVISISGQSAVPGLSENPLLQAVRDTHAPFHKVVLRERTVKVGDEKYKRHRHRIKMEKALKNMLRQLAKFSNSARADAAKAILREWDAQIKPVSGDDYDEVNAYMDKVIALLKSDAVKPHLEMLTLTDAAADVETAETDFRTLSLEQTRSNAELRLQGSATKRRPPVEKALGNYLKYITVMRSQPGYDLLYSKLSEAVKTARKAAKKPLPEEGTEGV